MSTMRSVVLKVQNLIVAFMILGALFVSCGDEDKIDTSLPKLLNIVGEVKDQAGVIHYDQSYQVWYILVDDNGDSDASIQRFDILCYIDSAYKEEGLPVLFSGEILQWIDKAEGDPLNSGNLVITISNIRNNRNKQKHLL